jgi:glycerol kinase
MSSSLAIDQSTAGTKALLVDEHGFIKAKDSLAHKQFYPAPGWVEHDAEEICRRAQTNKTNGKQAHVLEGDIAVISL